MWWRGCRSFQIYESPDSVFARGIPSPNLRLVSMLGVFSDSLLSICVIVFDSFVFWRFAVGPS